MGSVDCPTLNIENPVSVKDVIALKEAGLI